MVIVLAVSLCCADGNTVEQISFGERVSYFPKAKREAGFKDDLEILRAWKRRIIRPIAFNRPTGVFVQNLFDLVHDLMIVAVSHESNCDSRLWGPAFGGHLRIPGEPLVSVFSLGRFQRLLRRSQ